MFWLNGEVFYIVNEITICNIDKILLFILG